MTLTEILLLIFLSPLVLGMGFLALSLLVLAIKPFLPKAFNE